MPYGTLGNDKLHMLHFLKSVAISGKFCFKDKRKVFYKKRTTCHWVMEAIQFDIIIDC